MAERLDDFSYIFFNNFLKKIKQEDLITYPSYQEYLELIKLIAKYNHCNYKKVYIDSGSDACIKNVIQCLCEKGSNFISSTPSFPMYSIYAQSFGVKSTNIQYNDDLSLPLLSFLKSINRKTRMVILANPNSPYGDYKSIKEIKDFTRELKKKNIFLLLDEAYVEFSPGSMIKLLNQFDNLIISRTFSKAWGAAGCRVGYIFASEKIIKLLMNVQLTFPISCISIKFIKYLLQNSKKLNEHFKQVKNDRDKLCDLLENNGYDVVRSHINSIHFHQKKGNNDKPLRILNKYGVAFKKGSKTGTPINVTGDKRKTWIRISIGKNIQKINYIKEILNC